MDHNLEIRHCRILVALSDHGSISAAARSLGLAQSTVSETLLSFERLIDAPLTLRRRGQQATLTAAARALLPHARALISASEAALDSIKGTTRVIHLGAVESASTFLLPYALSKFRKQWPSVELKISIGVCDELHRKVNNGELDAAITLDGSDEHVVRTDNCSRVLAVMQLCLFVSRRRISKTGDAAQLNLTRHGLLLPDPDGPFNVLLRNWLAKRVDHPRMESAGSIDGVKIGVRNNNYVGVLPSYAIAKELKSGEFVRLEMCNPPPKVALALAVRSLVAQSSVLNNMIEHIERAVMINVRSAERVARVNH